MAGVNPKRPPCRTCADPRRPEIDAALDRGVSLRTLAARFGIPRATLQRHAGHRHNLDRKEIAGCGGGGFRICMGNATGCPWVPMFEAHRKGQLATEPGKGPGATSGGDDWEVTDGDRAGQSVGQVMNELEPPADPAPAPPPEAAPDPVPPDVSQSGTDGTPRYTPSQRRANFELWKSRNLQKAEELDGD